MRYPIHQNRPLNNLPESVSYHPKVPGKHQSGTCPTVSAAGLTQGGGWGHSARMFGLACDNLIEAYVTFWQATQIDASTYPDSEKFRFAGRFTQVDYSENQIKSILGLVKNRAKGATYCSVALYAMGGRIHDLLPHDTAFFYRYADYIIGIETIWEDSSAEPENLRWIASRFKCLHSLTMGSYVNFPYLCTDNYMNAYYGDNAGRLLELKKQYDPHNIFCFEQSIDWA